MKNAILYKVNKHLRMKRPILDSNIICDTYRNNTFLEIAFISKCCRNDAQGACVMCDYGAISGTKSESVYLNEMRRILSNSPGIQYLLLCANGSIMDEHQLSENTFCAILKEVGTTDIPNVIIETHYQDITVDKLRYIKEFLPQKNITMEIGLETISQEIQDAIIMKGVIIGEVEKTITNIHAFGMEVDLNIMLGLPFLSAQEQFEDTLNSVKWALRYNCNPIIFPLNIKPFTLLMHMYQSGYYKPVSHWMMLLLLNEIESQDLQKITISYYGNRTDEYLGTKEETIYPLLCSKCKNVVMDFYENFFRENDGTKRQTLLAEILAWKGCDCLEEQKRNLKKQEEKTFSQHLDEYITLLTKEFSNL